MRFWDAVASVGPYANNLHIVPDRKPQQLPTTRPKLGEIDANGIAVSYSVTTAIS